MLLFLAFAKLSYSEQNPKGNIGMMICKIPDTRGDSKTCPEVSNVNYSLFILRFCCLIDNLRNTIIRYVNGMALCSNSLVRITKEKYIFLSSCHRNGFRIDFAGFWPVIRHFSHHKNQRTEN